MNAIKLTDDQESKIIEMSYGLFPELEIKWGGSDGYYGGPGDYDMLRFKTDDDLDLIHWFEFCLMWLAPKILDNSHGDIETSDLGYFSYGPDVKIDHPVDYLYEKFRQLELKIQQSV